MFRNVANQRVRAQLVAAADGANVTSGTTNVFVKRDDNSQAAGGNTTATHAGNGTWEYVTTAGDTDGDVVTFTFVNSTAVSVAITYETQDKFASDVLNRAAGAMAYGTVGTGSTTTVINVSGITLRGGGSSVGSGDPLAGRRILFDTNTTTTNLRGAGARIVSHTSGSTPAITIDSADTLPTAPASGDIFVIV